MESLHHRLVLFQELINREQNQSLQNLVMTSRVLLRILETLHESWRMLVFSISSMPFGRLFSEDFLLRKTGISSRYMRSWALSEKHWGSAKC